MEPAYTIHPDQKYLTDFTGYGSSVIMMKRLGMCWLRVFNPER